MAKLDLRSLSVFDALFNFAFSDEFWKNLQIAFGRNYDESLAKGLRAQWLNRDFSKLPEIELLDPEILG